MRPLFCKQCEIIKEIYPENDPFGISRKLWYYSDNDELKRLTHEKQKER